MDKWHEWVHSKKISGTNFIVHKTVSFRALFWSQFPKGHCFSMHFLYKNSARGVLKQCPFRITAPFPPKMLEIVPFAKGHHFQPFLWEKWCPRATETVPSLLSEGTTFFWCCTKILPFCRKRHRFPKWCPKDTVLVPFFLWVLVLSIRSEGTTGGML